MSIRQIKQHSGTVYHLNLDHQTCERAKEIMAHYAGQDAPVSMSVLVRRAIRAYAEHVEDLKTEEERLREACELLKAGRGS